VEEKRFRMKSYTCLFVVCLCRMLDSLVAYNMKPPWRQEIVPVIKLVGLPSTQHLAFVEFALCIQLSWPSNLFLKQIMLKQIMPDLLSNNNNILER
jgi:hypothetical protein